MEGEPLGTMEDLMTYRKLGKTGLTVSEVSFGSHLSKENAENPAQRRKQIHAGIDAGINLFDIYEHSYKQYAPMSKALAGVRDEVLISLVTVWRAVDEVMEEVEHALDAFTRTCIDLYRVVLGKDWDDGDRRLQTLARAKEQGKIRAIGGVVHQPEHLLEALRRYADILEFIMAPASFCAPLLIREDREIAPALRTHDLGVIAIKSMGATARSGGSEGYIFRLQPPGRGVEALRQKGLKLGTLAVKYLLQSDLLSTVMPTMNSIDEVRESVSASGAGPLTGDEARFLDTYRTEGDRAFPEMLPENDYWITPWQA